MSDAAALLQSFERIAAALPPERVPEDLVRRMDAIRFSLAHGIGIPQAYAMSYSDYLANRAAYYDDILGVISEYLATDNAKITRFKSEMKRAMVEAFGPAYEVGWADGSDGGDYWQDAEADDKAWYNAKQDAEFANIDQMFQRLKEIKKEGPDAWQGEPERRANGYARTLDGIYNEGRLRGAKNKMLTFGGEDGQESCDTCQRLKGQRHRASWWIRRGLVPGQPGNDAFDCGGWRCQHYLYDDQGRLFTF